MYAMILGVSSYLLAISASWGCYTTKVDFVMIGKSPRQYTNAGDMGIGLFSFEDKAAASALTCKMYSNEQVESFDSVFHAARYLGILANICIGSCMILLVCLTCIVVRKPVIRGVSALLFSGCLLMGSTFILYASEAMCESCEIMFGTYLTAVCTIVTFINAIITYHIPEADDSESRHYSGEEFNAKTRSGSGEDGDVQATSSSEEDGEDGTSVWTAPGSPKRRQIIKTIVNQDGVTMVEDGTVVETPNVEYYK